MRSRWFRSYARTDGTVKGTKNYETQIGGETYVPRIKAKYIEE